MLWPWLPFTAKEVHNAGIDGRTLKAAGFTDKEVHTASIGGLTLKTTGFTVTEEVHTAGIYGLTLKAAGFNDAWKSTPPASRTRRRRASQPRRFTPPASTARP